MNDCRESERIKYNNIIVIFVCKRRFLLRLVCAMNPSRTSHSLGTFVETEHLERIVLTNPVQPPSTHEPKLPTSRLWSGGDIGPQPLGTGQRLSPLQRRPNVHVYSRDEEPSKDGMDTVVAVPSVEKLSRSNCLGMIISSHTASSVLPMPRFHNVSQSGVGIG
jgi:hypothetical protein